MTACQNISLGQSNCSNFLAKRKDLEFKPSLNVSFSVQQPPRSRDAVLPNVMRKGMLHSSDRGTSLSGRDFVKSHVDVDLVGG